MRPPHGSDCTTIQSLLPFFVNQTLDPTKCSLVKAHLDSCRPCAEHLLSWRNVACLVGDAVSALPKSLAAQSRVLAELRVKIRHELPECQFRGAHLIKSPSDSTLALIQRELDRIGRARFRLALVCASPLDENDM